MRLFMRRKRFWNCVPPHSSSAGCQLDAVRPAVPATGRGSPGAIGNILAEQLAFVGDDDDVVLLRVLREAGDLLLNLFETAIGTAAAGLVFELALLDDLHAEALGGAPQGIGIELVFGLRAYDTGTSCAIASRRDTGPARRRAWCGSAADAERWRGSFLRAMSRRRYRHSRSAHPCPPLHRQTSKGQPAPCLRP